MDMVQLVIDMNVLEICRRVVDCESRLQDLENEKDILEKRLEVINELMPHCKEELRELLSTLSSGVYTDIDNIDDNNVV